MFRLNIALSVAWVALIGELSVERFVEGFVLVALTLGITQHFIGQQLSYLNRIKRVTSFVLYFLKELVVSSWRVAVSVLSPNLNNIRPAVVAIPLDVKTDEEITLLANVITLTPGTLSLDVSADKKTLYVHTFNLDSVEAFRAEIKQGFERRIHEVMQW
ncbi:MAG: Na+/H+ antiporter subunit E [Chloroflexi bacterium]|nr:MAG: Na+/H+ antiporter subunit E [Chloroflexota bacterium]